MKDWTKKTMTAWQRQMFERIIDALCPSCKEGNTAEYSGGEYRHYVDEGNNEFSETRCIATPVRQELAKVYGPLVARSLFRKK